MAGLLKIYITLVVSRYEYVLLHAFVLSFSSKIFLLLHVFIGAGVVNFGGLRIAGISGIYKEHDYKLGHYERPPYDRGTLRSVYHVRNVEVYRLQQLKLGNEDSNIDIMLSHDWPRGIEQFGDTQALLRKKQFFRSEVETNTLGSPAGEILLHSLKPKRWFAGHLHVKFEATVHYPTHSKSSSPMPISWDNITGWEATTTRDAGDGKRDYQKTSEASDTISPSTQFFGLESSAGCCENASSNLTQQMTKFLALDKCLPQRNFLQIVTMTRPESEVEKEPELKYDLDWLVILRKTAHLTVASKTIVKVPNSPLEITQQDVNEILQKFSKLENCDPKLPSSYDLRIPRNFEITVSPHQEGSSPFSQQRPSPMIGNPQTDHFLNMLDLQHVITVPYRPNPLVQRGREADILQETSREMRCAVAERDLLEHDDNEIELDEDEGLHEIANDGTAPSSEEIFDGDEILLDDDNISTDDIPEVKKPRTD